MTVKKFPTQNIPKMKANFIFLSNIFVVRPLWQSKSMIWYMPYTSNLFIAITHCFSFLKKHTSFSLLRPPSENLTARVAPVVFSCFQSSLSWLTRIAKHESFTSGSYTKSCTTFNLFIFTLGKHFKCYYVSFNIS